MTVINYLMNKYILTRQGAKDLIKSIIYTVILNISLALPMGLYVLLLDDFIHSFEYSTAVTANLAYYLLAIIIITAILLIVEWKQYHFMYNTTYIESEKMRVNLAEKIRKLPLSFFENRNLSDLSSMIMSDCTDIEHLISHALPALYGSIISMIIITAGLACINYRLTAALIWVIPVSFILIILTRRTQEKHHAELYTRKRKVNHETQELLESIKDLKSYTYDTKYLQKLDNTIEDMIHTKTRSEIVTGLGVITSTMILKIGLVSVLLAGSALLIQGQITLITLIIFLMAASLIYTPLENALEYLAEIFASATKLDRMREIENMKTKPDNRTYRTIRRRKIHNIKTGSKILESNRWNSNIRRNKPRRHG